MLLALLVASSEVLRQRQPGQPTLLLRLEPPRRPIEFGQPLAEELAAPHGIVLWSELGLFQKAFGTGELVCHFG